MAHIISLAARRAARQAQDGQEGHRPNVDASEATPCSVLLFTGIRYDHAPGRAGRPWFGRLETRDAAEPGTT